MLMLMLMPTARDSHVGLLRSVIYTLIRCLLPSGARTPPPREKIHAGEPPTVVPLHTLRLMPRSNNPRRLLPRSWPNRPAPCILHLPLIPCGQADLLPWLESRQSHVRTPVAPEGVPQRAVATAAHLALHREVHLCQVVGGEFRDGRAGERGEFPVGGLAGGGVFGGDFGGEAAGAVFAGAAAFAGRGAAFGRCGEEGC